MLSEFALSPAVFRQNSYESSAVADVCLGTMRGALLEDSVVRNLRAGEWAVYLSSQRDLLYPKAKELLKKLISQKRLVEHSSCGGPSPKTDESWENEAIRSHEVKPLSGLIFSRESKEERHSDKPFVACPERLVRTNFWTQRSCSCRLPRNATEYTRLLRPIFCYANFIAFIDPHIDPERPQYRDFLRLLLDPILIQRGVKPRIELHRVAWKGTGHDRRPMVQDVLPDEWIEQWPFANGNRGVTWLEQFDKSRSDEDVEATAKRDRAKHTFGNLTLLTQPLNSSVSNSAFEIKKPEILKNSALALNRYFQDREYWDEAAIAARGDTLFAHAVKKWPYPAPAMA